ncbi:MAG: serine hydrolase domain-containing protein [Flavobacteriales bacterium]
MKTLLYTLFILISLQCFGQSKLQKNLNHYRDSILDYGIVALVDNGKQIETAQIGWASKNKPITIQNRFCIGSVTKMLTSTLVLKLQEEKRLSINDSLHTYLPHHPFIDSNITIKQLLNHTSGIKDVVVADLMNKALLEPKFDFSDDYLLSLIDTVDFLKGEQYRYSNSNFLLLRKILEIASDKPYSALLEEYIIKPLKLENTFPYHSKGISNLAHPMVNGQDFQDWPKIGVNKISVGIGNVVSDIYDLNRILRAIFIEKTIINTSSLNQMKTFKSYKNNKIGLGVFQEQFGNKTLVGHTGRSISYICYAFVEESSGTSFVLINNNANDYFIDELIEVICD